LSCGGRWLAQLVLIRRLLSPPGEIGIDDRHDQDGQKCREEQSADDYGDAR
jgi:hypothetical protein